MSLQTQASDGAACVDVVVTGATGFIGRYLVPVLEREGYRLLLVGRSLDRLEQWFPEHTCCTLGDMAHKAKGAKALIHLAVRNNDVLGSEEAFLHDNLEGLKQVVSGAVAAGITHVIYPGSLHASEGAKTAYGRSKYAAEAYLLARTDLTLTRLRLPAVYGTRYKGKLSALNTLPGCTHAPLLAIFGSLVPTVHVDRVIGVVLESLKHSAAQEIYVTNPQSENPVYRVFSRVMDLGFASLILAVFWWLLLLVWAGVRLTSSGPGLFVQRRVGKGQKVFACYKFRTMHQGTRQAGTHEVSEASVTSLGRRLRRLKIDELPQVWNLLTGEMSLVGPRPCLPVQEELIGARAARDVFDVRPGVTGLAQVNGIDMSQPGRLAEIDAQYIAERTLLLDLKIVLATAFGWRN